MEPEEMNEIGSESHPTASQSSRKEAQAVRRPSPETYAFQFVEVGNPSKNRDEDVQSVIRSHVMRDFYERRDQPKPNTAPQAASIASTKEGVSQQTHRFRVGPQGLKEVNKKQRKGKSTPQTTKKVSSLATDGLNQEVAATTTPFDYPNTTISSPVQLETSTLPLTDHCDRINEAAATDGNGSGGTTDLIIGRTSLQPNSASCSRDAAAPEFLPTGCKAVDPFNTHPLINNPTAQRLLYHARQTILASQLMGQLRTEWLALATQDLALFYAALSHYAGNYRLLIKREVDPLDALRFRMEAMRIINIRLKFGEHALTDGTVGAVASLASYEATNGTLEELRAHLTGLKRMVALRGGINQSSMNQYTKRLVLWADLNCANALGSDPIFPIPQGYEQSSIFPPMRPDAEGEMSWTKTISEEIPDKDNRVKAELLRIELNQSLSRLKYLINIHVTQTNAVKADRIRDSDRLYLTERSLLDLANFYGPQKFVTTACIAATICLDNHLRGVRFNAMLMDRLISRLYISMKMVLGEISRHHTTEKSTKAILWVLFVGGTVAGARSEKSWFLRQLVDSCNTLELQSWEEAELILRDILWPETWTSPGRLVWEQIQETRRIEGVMPQAGLSLEMANP